MNVGVWMSILCTWNVYLLYINVNETQDALLCLMAFHFIINFFNMVIHIDSLIYKRSAIIEKNVCLLSVIIVSGLPVLLLMSIELRINMEKYALLSFYVYCCLFVYMLYNWFSACASIVSVYPQRKRKDSCDNSCDSSCKLNSENYVDV